MDHICAWEKHLVKVVHSSPADFDNAILIVYSCSFVLLVIIKSVVMAIGPVLHTLLNRTVVLFK